MMRILVNRYAAKIYIWIVIFSIFLLANDMILRYAQSRVVPLKFGKSKM